MVRNGTADPLRVRWWSTSVAIDTVLLTHLEAAGMNRGLIGHLAARTARGDSRAERRIRDATGSTPAMDPAGRVAAMVGLAPGVISHGGTLILSRAGGGVPQTLTSHLVGRPLSVVIDHALLPLDASIVGIEDRTAFQGAPSGSLGILTDAEAVRVRAVQWHPVHLASTLIGDMRYDQGLTFAMWSVGVMLGVIGMFALAALCGSVMAATALMPLVIMFTITVAMSRSAWVSGSERRSMTNQWHTEEAAERWSTTGRWG